MKQGLSITRRIARAVFIGLGTIMTALVIVPIIVDQEIRKDFLRFDLADGRWATRFQGAGTWFVAGVLFLIIAVLIRRVGILGMSVFLLLNVVALGAFWKFGHKAEVLLLPLGITFICLVVEETGLLRQFVRRTT